MYRLENLKKAILEQPEEVELMLSHLDNMITQSDDGDTWVTAEAAGELMEKLKDIIDHGQIDNEKVYGSNSKIEKLVLVEADDWLYPEEIDNTGLCLRIQY